MLSKDVILTEDNIKYATSTIKTDRLRKSVNAVLWQTINVPGSSTHPLQ